MQISGCGALEIIEEGAFEDCADLEHVEITQNRRLHHISENAFGGSTLALRRVDLSDNALSSLGAGLVNWRGLKAAFLAGNPWRCDCELGELIGALGAMEAEAEADADSSNEVLVAQPWRSQLRWP